MKNRYTIYGCLVALMGLVAMFGCTDELDGIKNTNGRPSDVICFTTSLSGSRGTSVSRGASGHLAIEQEEWLVATEKEQGASRGAPVTLLNGSAGVIGYVYDAWTDEGEDATKPLFHNKQFNFDGDELTAESGDIRWATFTQSKVKFYAYAPYDQTGGILSNTQQGGSPQLAYTVNKTPKNQHDLIVASWEGQSNYKQSIPLTFEHALTAIKFKVGFPCKVTKLEVEGIYNSGTYTFGDGWKVNTTSNDVISNYKFTFGDKIPGTDDDYTGIEFSAGEFLTDGENTLMMIPQTLSANAQVVLTYIEGEETKTITSTLKNKVWQEGKMITYTIHQNAAPTTVYFDLAAGNVNIQPATQKNKDNYKDYLKDVSVGDIIYIGSVYVNGESVRYAGEHNEKNRYYVYQSSEAVQERNTNKHTGYVTEEDFADRETVECRIPSYAPVEYEGQLWSDYITNNTNVQQVIVAWDDDKGAGKATSDSATPTATPPNQSGAQGAVRDVGRQATKNRIHIKGNVGNVNLTIDNIYSSYQQRGSTPVRSRTEGGISFIPSWTNGHHSVLTINIIGDNRLGCVNYQNTNPNINCLVFEGTGSLTVGDVDYFRDGSGLGSNRSCSVIGGADTPTDDEDVFNIKINSGVIYAGATTSTCTAIGGGGNGDTKITINGGTITAVTNSTGAAIGGGTGQIQPGGIGNVTINGGNVYAYNLRAVNTTVPAAAIGGGGSTEKEGNSGNVTINGGYVYAYSGCGTAIGGGSSQDMQGGSANIIINGGQVIAKSDNGTGIGGGTGSAKNNNNNGGNARVTISGNPIIRTGSIGGGGKGPQSTGTIGAASITIEENSEADIQAQFVLAAGIASGAENKFEMKGGTIRNSYADDKEYLHIQKKGGAVYLEEGTFTMSGGTIKNCSAEQGGAVYINSRSGKSTFTMTGGEIHSCFATGTYNNAGTLTAPGHGGAVCLMGGQVKMEGGKIWKNYSENGDGGAIYISNGNFAMTHSSPTITEEYPTITRNAVHKGNGGGVFVTSQGQEVEVDLLQGVITYNTSNNYGGGVCVDMGVGTSYSASVMVGEERQGDEQNTNPNISGNTSLMSGGGLYVRGASANITINGGNIKGNSVSAYVKNENVANEGGMVTLNADNVTDIVTITFHDIDGLGNEIVYAQKVVSNTNTNLQKCDDVIDGKKFVRWNNRSDGNGTIKYKNGDKINISENITLYAIREDQ